jgi:hypothetical protein
MKTRILAAIALGCALSGTALADTVMVNDKLEVRDSQMATPKRGTTMGEVEKRFGAPVDKHPTVGQPPITRWDYNGFAVVFERDRVVDSVVTGG